MNPTEDVLRALPGHLSRNQRNDGRGQSSPVQSLVIHSTENLELFHLKSD